MRKILLVITAAMLLICLAPMQYGYYQLVRFVSMVAFAYLAYHYYKSNKVGISYLFVALALLFQPFMKVALGRTVWNIVDVIVSLLLIVILFNQDRKN